ncbi:efflux RND transporter periplasmic adaptor subunit [Undibacterium sp. Jales W-56]|uniref:efflux RND transporter periplasmic adaptor subunit n=1 Tax=Undibacterium sp. Jales W-56 TaxID=2897325 RepID=UPI0021D1B262|nr:efflux RND transporter periplasmic adaptor subunit [Undibacterium sp. Jales W-56]MCU6432757.1 efflux RND transporter periplasmic adaptor subunit [Undibacterium sp. Jales W-56]
MSPPNSDLSKAIQKMFPISVESFESFAHMSANPVSHSSIRLWLIASLSLPLLTLSACGKQDANAAAHGGMPPPEVNVVTVQPRNLAMDFEYVGQTAGSRETEVRARISGILEKRVYEEGSRVKAGSVLFQIDPGTYQTQLASAEAAAGVTEAKLNQARREFARLTPLAAEKAISQKEFDDAKSNLETAEATYKQSRAQVNEAKLNLGYTKVVAPIGGVTGIANKSNGSLVTPSDSLLTTIVQTDPIYVNFSVTEADYLKLSKDVTSGKIALPGKRATNGSLAFDIKLKLADGSIYPTTGKMNFASEKVNPANGGFDARAQIPNPEGNLRPGQFVRVILNGATRSAALAIPQRAVIDSPMGKIVFTVSPDNKLAPRPVELDGWSNGEWIVTKGLQAGDRVLVDGFIKAHDPGMTVTPVALTAQAAVTPAPALPPASAGAKPAAESASAKAAPAASK